MPAETKLRVVLCWHMHQPNYFDPVTGEYKLPWTYLHAIKDYIDMAAHIEAVPGARAVVNFVPILLEQIDDYARQTAAFISSGAPLKDHLLASLVTPALPVDAEQRATLIKACLRANERTIIRRFPAYARLADMAARLADRAEELMYINDQYLADIVTWYHLGWMGETVRRTDARVQRLIDRGSGYTLHDRHELMHVIAELLADVIPRYRRLAERGQVELSVTPYAHPIMPLLLDIASMREAMPESPLPLLERYPGGEERARWHIRRGLEVFENHFGQRPRGCWPAEGAVSDATLKLLAGHGFTWAATGESVLRNSLNRIAVVPEEITAKCTHRVYDAGGVHCFFRDDGLSDLIGFQYANWHADDAVSDLIHHLENIAATCAEAPDSVVSIIMDGENAWEYYPENGYYFLSALYRRLAAHPRLTLTTFSSCADQIVAPRALPHVVAGSWVYGTFSTWIGERDKNRGWDMLGDAKLTYDRVMAIPRLNAAQRSAAEQQLAICEGSDWFWWFGDYNPADAVSDFEQLYRLQLATLYQLLHEEPPEYLSHSFTHGRGNPAAGGVMRPGQEAK